MEAPPQRIPNNPSNPTFQVSLTVVTLSTPINNKSSLSNPKES